MYPYQFNNAPQIIRVNGENGANMLMLPANSSALALDNTAPLVWLVQTDTNGLKNITPYKIEPYKVEPALTLEDIATRLNELEAKLNDKSNTKQTKSSKPTDGAND